MLGIPNRAMPQPSVPGSGRVPIYLDPVVGWALAFAFITRVLLAIASWFSLRVIPRPEYLFEKLPDSFFPGNPAIDGWVRWDSSHYIALARFGYGGDNPSAGGGWGFFPLYSLLMRGLTEILFLPATDRNLAIAGLVIANLCFIGLVVLVARWCAELYGDHAARTTVVLLCLSPFAYFFNAVYTESLFVLLVVGTLMLASKNRWMAAGLVAGLATGTRLVGLALIPALLLLAYRRKASLLDVVTSIGLSCYGILAFGVYSAFETGNPFEYFDAQSEWGGWTEHVRRYAELFIKHPRETINGDPLNLVILFNVMLLIIALAWLPSVWRRTDAGVALFTTLIVVIQGAMTWVSLGRYLLPAIGVYFVAGRWLADPKRSPWTREWVTAASAIAITTLTILFAHGFWVI
ncbi:hypothetical protein BH09CHL1_BH09CHL1_24410 [soil metagenome]